VEIHKPKPWQGFREFLKEYLIIVVGVLTALGAEAVVERLHWAREVGAAREALKPEYLRLMEWVGHQDGEAACVGRRLDDLQVILDKAAATHRLPPLGPPDQPTRDPWRLRAWDGLVSGQVLPHLDKDVLIAVTGVATNADYLVKIRDDEMSQWAVLQTLMGPGRTIDASELSVYRRTLGQAERDGSIMRISSDLLAKNIAGTGYLTQQEAEGAWQKGVNYGQSWVVCKPMTRVPKTWSHLEPALTSPVTRPF
jgi:hypothetical protein